jgi:hypothetical protein
MAMTCRKDGRTLDVGELPQWADSAPATAASGTTAVRTILLKNPLLWRPHLGLVALSARQIPGLLASCGEDGRREWNELRQFSQILGGGGQQELVLGSIWAAQAQSTEPEDALQMSEQHLDFLSFAT